MCRSFGMELLAPDTEEEVEVLTTTINGLKDLPRNFHTGFSAIGTRDKWYNINTGNVLNFDIPWNPLYNEKEEKCSSMQFTNEHWLYQDTKCMETENRFICQKVDRPAHGMIVNLFYM